MILRSTGLGKSELTGDVANIRAQGDYLILEVQTREPVNWKIRAGLSREDLRMIIKAIFKHAIIAFLLNIRGWIRKPEHPGEY